MVADMTAVDGVVIVAGSINVDLIVGVSRLPTAGETVLGDRFVQQNGGKSANQAVAASRVGATVIMLGAVGGDDLGRSALEGLASEGVDVSSCRRVANEHTGLALIVVDAVGENQIAVAQGANRRLDASMIQGQTAELHPPPGAVCLLGFEVPDEAVLAAARWAVGHGLRLIINPAPARPLLDELIALSPILTPNESEAELLTGSADPEAAAGILAARTKAPVDRLVGCRGRAAQHGRTGHASAGHAGDAGRYDGRR